MLRAGTYLGDNTIAALAEIVAQVTASTDIAMSFDQVEPLNSSHARRHAASFDLLWVCGALFAEMNAEGSLDHDAIAAPVFDGEKDAVYRSMIVARADGPTSLDDALDSTVAINEWESWSGHSALRRHVGPSWFAREVLSGSHRASINAVVEGTADCAAIDHSVWNAERSGGGSATKLVVIGQTVDWPAPPFVLRRSIDQTDRARLLAAMVAVDPVPGVSALRAAGSANYAPMRMSDA